MTTTTNDEHPQWFSAQEPKTDWSEADAARFDAMHGQPTYPGTTDRSQGPAAYPGDPARFDRFPHTAIGYQAQRMEPPSEQHPVIGYRAGKRHPAAPYEVVYTNDLTAIGRSLQMPDSAPPDLAQEIDELERILKAAREAKDFALDFAIANAARAALSDIETVIRHWSFGDDSIYPIRNLRALYHVLRDNPPT